MMATNELQRLGLAPGDTIQEVAVPPGEGGLRLRVLRAASPGPPDHVYWYCDADCCSETWISDLRDLHHLVGFPVLSLSTFDPPFQDDGRCRQEADRFYGLRFTTTRGTTELVYRNSSNGYYGGSLELVPGPFEADPIPPGTVSWFAPADREVEDG